MRFTTQWLAAGRLWCAIASESREEKKETAGNDKEEKSDGLLLENCFLGSSSKLATAFPSNGDLQNQVSTPLQDFSSFCILFGNNTISVFQWYANLFIFSSCKVTYLFHRMCS
jgi:hypothetical protein